MTKYLIKPYEGFNNICFGDLRENIRKLAGTYEEFRKNKFSKNTSDDFGDFHAFYDSENKLEAVEFFSGEIYLENKKLYPNTKQKLIMELKRIDEGATAFDDSINSKAIGVEAYVVNEDVKAILIGNRGYFS